MSESKKLNIDGGTIKGEDEPLATYKSIPETADVKKSTSSLNKKAGVDRNDGAAEKLLAKEDEAKGINMSEVRFISGDHLNGDAKIEIEGAKQAFSGLTKEELMKYANDPFWIKLRWTMFILFWSLWLLMLAGAVAIVICAPKCAAPAPKTWWEQGPLLEPQDKDFISLERDLPLIEEMEIKGVFIPDSGADSYQSVLEPDEIKSNSFKALAEKFKERGIRLIIELTANCVQKTSEWFIKSEKKEEPFKDYFIWADPKDISSTGEKIPPSNWLSLVNGSAWQYSETRKQFYLRQFNSSTADLNFRNPDVVKEFDKVIEHWTSLGFAGVRLSKAKHLLVDPTFSDESMSRNLGAVHTEYVFYSHGKTTHQPGLGDILTHWRAVLQDHSGGEGVFTMDDLIDLNSAESYRVNGTDCLPIDIPSTPDLAKFHEDPKLMVRAIVDTLKNPLSLSELWPAWRHSGRPSDRISELNLIVQLLPGVPIVTLNQITSKGENQTQTKHRAYEELLKLREKPSALYGSLQIRTLHNETVFAFTRLKAGNPGMMIVYNPTRTNIIVDTTSFGDVPAALTIQAMSDNYLLQGIERGHEVPSNALPLPPLSGIVLTYVPKKDE